jgi:hypothetical protein
LLLNPDPIIIPQQVIGRSTVKIVGEGSTTLR